MPKLELFGGAITAEGPLGLIDASDLRQVPDNQEVFMYPNSSVSIIVEVLQAVEPQGDTDAIKSEAIKFHFDSLANDNSAETHEIQEIQVLSNGRGDQTQSAIVLRGLQRVRKFNRSALDTVQIRMALCRVKHKNIDLVVTFNIPIESEDGGAVKEEAVQKDFENFVTSLQIVDFDLFA